MRIRSRAILPVLLLGSAFFTATALAHDIQGHYIETGVNASGKHYKGGVTIRKYGETYDFISDDNTWNGVGILQGDILSIGYIYRSNGHTGVMAYTIGKGDKGPTLDGKWADFKGEGKLATDTLTFESKGK